MSDRTYKIILEGTVKEGVDRSGAVAQLAQLFKKDAQTAEKLLAGKPRIIRRHVDHPTALKYQKVLEGAGATARVEPEDEQLVKIVTAQPSPEADTLPTEREAIVCPRCGYESKREDDVLRVRGDCPRCGLQVVRPDDLADPVGASADDDLDWDANPESAYAGLDSASWERRACAATYTLALFLAFCFSFVLMSIFFLVPMESVPEFLTRRFLEAALTSFPTLTASAGIFIVLFVMPLATAGRTWGQKAFDIQLFFTDEGQTGGLALSLAFRTVAAGLVSFVPGRLVLWILSWWEIFPEWKWGWFLMGVAALLGWSIAWVYGVRRADGRGLLDQAAGTVQLEAGLLPAGALTNACKPLAGVVALILFVGVALPYATQWLK
jgi:hypothetical protein